MSMSQMIQILAQEYHKIKPRVYWNEMNIQHSPYSKLRSDFEMVYDITNLNRTLTKSSTVQNDMKIHEIRTKYVEDK